MNSILPARGAEVGGLETNIDTYQRLCLIAIFKHLREVQVEIDRAFDDIASKVGFVFTTTMPVSHQFFPTALLALSGNRHPVIGTPKGKARFI